MIVPEKIRLRKNMAGETQMGKHGWLGKMLQGKIQLGRNAAKKHAYGGVEAAGTMVGARPAHAHTHTYRPMPARAHAYTHALERTHAHTPVDFAHVPQHVLDQGGCVKQLVQGVGHTVLTDGGGGGSRGVEVEVCG